MNQDPNLNDFFSNWELNNPIAGFADWLITLSPVEFSIFTTFVGILLSQGLNFDQIVVWASFLRSISIIVSSYATQIELHEEASPSLTQFYELAARMQAMQKEIDKLKKK